MKILFASSDTIALPLLDALAQRGLVGAVFTSPDAPGKRGKSLIATPIKIRALELKLPVYTPEHLRTAERELVKALEVDTLLSFCYGKIFGPRFLSLFEHTFNVHPSLLPKYRGCAPIFKTIREGDKEGGISVQKIDTKIDEGEIYKSIRVELDGTETAVALEEKVSLLVPDLVLSVLDHLSDTIAHPQEGKASYSSFITKEDGRIDWSMSASSIHALIRACYPWPRAWCMIGEDKLLITGVYGSGFDSFSPCTEAPGTVIELEKNKGLKIATGSGYIYVSRVLPPMKKEMDASAFVNGNRAILGAVLH